MISISHAIAETSARLETQLLACLHVGLVCAVEACTALCTAMLWVVGSTFVSSDVTFTGADQVPINKKIYIKIYVTTDAINHRHKNRIRSPN